jgi:hypothetical protein
MNIEIHCNIKVRGEKGEQFQQRLDGDKGEQFQQTWGWWKVTSYQNDFEMMTWTSSPSKGSHLQNEQLDGHHLLLLWLT